MEYSNIYRFKPLEFNFINDESVVDSIIKWPDISWPRIWAQDYVKDIVSTETKAWLLKIGLPVGVIFHSSRLFHTRPLVSSDIHNDGHRDENGNLVHRNRWSINYIWGTCKRCDMIWYEEIEKDRPIVWNNEASTLGTTYQYYDVDNLRPIQTENYVAGLALVCVDKPHRVQNLDPEGDRYCLSIRSPDNRSWEEAVEFFRPHLEI